MSKRLPWALGVAVIAWAMLLIAAEGRAQSRPDGGAVSTVTITEKTAATQKLPGYFPLYWDAKQGKLWLEIDKWSTEFLYESSLPAGIRSNDIGPHRGHLRRIGGVPFY